MPYSGDVPGGRAYVALGKGLLGDELVRERTRFPAQTVAPPRDLALSPARRGFRVRSVLTYAVLSLGAIRAFRVRGPKIPSFSATSVVCVNPWKHALSSVKIA